MGHAVDASGWTNLEGGRVNHGSAEEGAVAFRPGVGIMATVEDRVYVGASPHQAVVIRGPAVETEMWLRGMDGRTGWAEQVASAARFGIRADDAHRVLAQLESSGLTVPGGGASDLLGRVVVVGDADSTRILARRLERRGLSSSSLVLPRVRIGSDDDCEAAAAFEWLVSECRRADLVVISMRRCVPDAGELAFGDRLLSAEIPHLTVAPGRARRLGPLVIPGSGACLRCEHLAMVEVNPDWSEIVQQWAWQPPSAVDLIDLEVAASDLAVWLAEGVGSLRSEVFERTWPGGRWRHRTLRPHPGCGCWWPGGISPVGPPAIDW